MIYGRSRTRYNARMNGSDWFNRKIVRTDAAGGERSGSVTRSYNRKAGKRYFVRPAIRI